MIKELFSKQKTYINSFFDHLKVEETEVFVQMLLDCKGSIFFTGVGKSGLIAEKLAMTMVSTGMRAGYVPPTNALHGDLGVVQEGDIFIFLSKSGESDELVSLIPFVRNKGAKTVCWVCKVPSRLEKACDLSIHLPLQRELCPFNLAPTTSDVVQLLYGNVVAVALMHARDFSLNEYASNHPAGRIGKRISMKVSDLMVKDQALPTCQPGDLLGDCLVELSNKRCGCLLVVNEEGEIEGMFTDGDLRRALQEKGSEALQLSVDQLMNRNFKQVESGALAYDAMKLMESDQKHPFMVLPVVEGKKVLGLVKLHDIIQSGL